MREEGISPEYWEEACAFLAERDEVLRGLIEQYKGELLVSHGDGFVTLARAVVGQQVSVSAADRLWERLQSGLGGRVTVDRVLAAGTRTLQGMGLSLRKAEYLVDLARYFAEGEGDQERWQGLRDEEVVRALSELRGIGRWTAEMFLIFHLLRPNVWPVDDVGLRRALGLLYGLPKELPRRAWLAAGERFQPWRTVATWYLWRFLDPVPVRY
ncbi:MAG: hypothetical protein N2557_00770 [Hydrogenophilus sp.]|nr:hypothetical protein [Hydrogenophilus sp.]